jgi:hypothetical protein
MTTKRAKRPKLERDRPVRTFSTLFGSAKGRPERRATTESSSSADSPPEPAPNPPPVAPALSDTVELGYRVIDEYLKQGQQVAQAFNPTAWAGRGAGSADDLQQMGQRVMQYGWDFAGLWFEMWSRMAGNTSAWMPIPGMPGMPGMPRPPGAEQKPGAAPVPNGASHNGAASVGTNGDGERVVVSVACERPTSTAVELRSGPPSELVVHALRAEDHEGPPIRDVRVERQPGDGTVVVKVTVSASQAPGTYNGLIIDSKTNLPRGTLSVRVDGKSK